VPPTLITTDYSALLSQVLPPFMGMHARHRMQSLKPIPVGARVVVHGHIEDKFEKRGKKYIVLAYEAKAEDGSTYTRNRISTTVSGYRSEEQAGDAHE
jgi:hypothetical protein